MHYYAFMFYRTIPLVKSYAYLMTLYLKSEHTTIVEMMLLDNKHKHVI